MALRMIDHGTREYQQMVNLRNEILRKPLGLYFTEEELVNLTLAIVAINGWNRLAIAFRSVPGLYQPRVP